MNERQVAFIICYNNELYYQECLKYISLLEVPDGYSVDIISITEAEEMAMAYNAAMESSNAKYKVYLHQDVFIYNRSFISDFLHIFKKNPMLGLMGVIGGKNLPQNAETWNSWNMGATFGCDFTKAFEIIKEQNPDTEWMEVEAVDGMLMVTQYDVKWREDLHLQWDFYDVSQSLEFIRRGYQVGIPFQKTPWCMHDCGCSNLKNYDSARRVVLAEYKDFFSEEFVEVYNQELIEIEESVFHNFKTLIDNKEMEKALVIAKSQREVKLTNRNLILTYIFLEIYEREKNANQSLFFRNCCDWNDIVNKYNQIKFMLRRVENGLLSENIQMLRSQIANKSITKEAIEVIIFHNIINEEAVSISIFQQEDKKQNGGTGVDTNIKRQTTEFLEITEEISVLVSKLLDFTNDELNYVMISCAHDLKDYCEYLIGMLPQIHLESDRSVADNLIEQLDLISMESEIQPDTIFLRDKLEEFAILIEKVVTVSRTQCKVCACCGNKVFYQKLPDMYRENRIKYGGVKFTPETLNENEYLCPDCYATDRDRFIISFLKKLHLDDMDVNAKLLQIAPAKAIEHWIYANCPAITYHTTDLFMNGVTFKSDIQDMNMVEDETYDYVICSHVLEHVQDDTRAMKELYRILKKDGFCIFLVPIAMELKQIDEEWGLTKEENWRRFGQDDHCRRYAKNGLVERLKNAGFIVNQLGKEYFGELIFNECGLIDTSILYVLGKTSVPVDELIDLKQEKRKQAKQESPLVSVIMSAYNHEEYVEKAIESVLGQTYANIEFLVADDASSDHTAEKILQYENQISQIHLFESNNCGRGRELVSYATGKYIAIMCSDDYWDSNKIEMQVAYMENHPECAACFTGVVSVNDEGEEVPGPFEMRNMSREEWMAVFYAEGNSLAHPSILARREIYKQHLFSAVTVFRQIPDFWMWVKMVQHYDIHIIEKELTYFRVHEKGNNINTSTPNNTNFYRNMNEETYMWYNVFKNMENSYFVKAFANYMIDKSAVSDKKIMCEKLFILLKSRIEYFKQAAIFYLYDIYQEEDIAGILEEYYGVTRNDIYQIVVNAGPAALLRNR